MDELSITVEIPGSPPATYKFCEPVVRIGRSADCHLAIYHQAVPRELCRAWLEDDGTTVRVEERPNLTNPLSSRKKRLVGGTSGAVVELSVGPVQLRLFPGRLREPDLKKKAHANRRPVLIAGIGLIALCLVMGLDRGFSVRAEGQGVPDLPETPLLPSSAAPCGSDRTCGRRAVLLATRADELLASPGAGPSEQVRAAALLARAGAMLQGSDSGDALVMAKKAEEIQQKIIAEYRREVLALNRAAESKDRPAAMDAAQRILDFLVDGDLRTRARLQRMARGDL